MIYFSCVRCQQPIEAESRQAGRSLRCPRCSAANLVPDASTSIRPSRIVRGALWILCSFLLLFKIVAGPDKGEAFGQISQAVMLIFFYTMTRAVDFAIGNFAEAADRRA